MIRQPKILFVFLYLLIQSVAQQLNIAQTATTLSQKRYALAATSSDELVFFGGGYTSTGVSNRVDICNATSGNWATATLSLPRGELAAASSGTLVFFAGGWDGSSTYYDRVDICHASNGSWSTATLSQARGFLAGVSVGSLVLFGGGGNNIGMTDVVDIYNVPNNTWTTTTLSQGRQYLVSTSVINRYALFAGGINSSGASSVVDIYDSWTGVWNTATLSQARTFLAAASLSSLALFGGGQEGSSFFQIVDIFNLTSKAQNTATLSQSRSYLAAAAIGDIVAFGGGTPDGFSSTPLVDLYNVTSNSWFTASLSQGRYWLAATSSSNQIFFGGGEPSQTASSNTVDVFCININCSFSILSPASPPPSSSVTSPSSSTSVVPLSPQSYSPSSLPTFMPYTSPLSLPSSNSSTLPSTPTPLLSPNSKSSNSSVTSTTGPITTVNTSPPEALLIGIVIGIIILLIVIGIILFLILFFKKRKQKKKRQQLSVNESSHMRLPSKLDSGSTQYAPIATVRREPSENKARAVELQPRPELEGFNGHQIPFGDIEVERELGTGSYGKVHLGRWNNAPVALKFCKKKEKIYDFLKEAQLLINLPPHPNVVQVYGMSIDGVEPVLVMEYCAGGSLENLLCSSGQHLTEQEKLDLVKGIARGVLHLHNNNIVHRDLAARNILLSETRIPKISDFGMSRILAREDEEGHTNTEFGPIRWMAPESIANKVYSQKSDVWSFGIVVWEIVAESLPYQDEDLVDVLVQIRDKARTPKIPEECPPLLRELMELCWKRQPEERPTLKEISQMLGK